MEILFAAQTAGEVHPAFSFILPLSIFVIFYFLLIRPQHKKQNDQKKFLSALEKNQEVVTLGGIHGTIVNFKDSVVTLRIAENVRIDIERSAISHPKA